MPLDTQSDRNINPWLIAVAVMSSTFMEVLDTTVVNVSLPHIAGNLSASTDEATWVLTSYLVANAIILSAAAWLSSWFGRKRYLAFSVALFVAASTLCGMAQSLPQLIVARVLQGLGGGGLQPLAQALMLECFAPEERGVAMAAYGMGIVVMPIIGPTLGGWITDNYSWRWIFYINVPIGILAALMARMFIEDPPYIKRERSSLAEVDYIGLCLITLGLGSLQIMLDRGEDLDWFGSLQIRIYAIAGVAGIIGAILWLLHTDKPIVNIRVYADRNFALASVMIFGIG